jgi:ubiquinone/menaquinone biosynthesis C-methylase UbiE
MSTQTTGDSYALGRTEAEELRLQRQALLVEPVTRRLFAAAGIGPGMHVLDLGSGPGDVAMLAAEMVGPTGSVVGVDVNPLVVETARRRAQAAGYANVTFVAGDLRELALDRDFDALVGRLVLMYLSDPVAALRQLLPQLRSGGVAAFHEMDFTMSGVAYPPSHLAEQVYRWITQAATSSGAETAMGMKMHRVLLDAGFEAPQMLLDMKIGGSSAFIEEMTAYLADTVRSLLPLLIKGGIATAEEVNIESLAARFRDELLRQGSVIRNYPGVGAWACKA